MRLFKQYTVFTFITHMLTYTNGKSSYRNNIVMYTERERIKKIPWISVGNRMKRLGQLLAVSMYYKHFTFHNLPFVIQSGKNMKPCIYSRMRREGKRKKEKSKQNG